MALRIRPGSLAKTLVLHVSKRVGLFALARRLTGRGLRILCYHGFELGNEGRFRPRLFIGLSQFAERMDLLARHGYPVLALDDALERLSRHTLPPGAVAITIDDGFYSVRSAAAILRDHGFPATVYVPTYYVERQAPIYRLVVRYIFALTPAVRLEAGRRWLPEGVPDLADAGARERAALRVIEFGERECTEAERQAICRELGRLLDVDYDAIVATRILALMNREELLEMPRFGVDVQLHTHRHRFPEEEAGARAEIAENRRALGALLGGGPYRHFCYPSGWYSRRQWPWLESLGIVSATTCEPGLNYADTPRLGLRRFLDDAQVGRIVFEAEVAGFLELARRVRAGLSTWTRRYCPGWSAAQRATGKAASA